MFLLLDIDGVMVKAASWKPVEILPDGFPAFGTVATQALVSIIEEAGASIVLTTSHKHHYSLIEWEAIFKNRGISVTINRLAPCVPGWSRKAEILNWLEKNEQDGFVIIDDDTSLNDLPARLKDKLVLTRSLVGLTFDDALKAVHILKTTEPVFA